MEVRARATHAANHLSGTFEPRTEGGWRVEMWFQAGVRRRRGDVGAESELANRPLGRWRGGGRRCATDEERRTDAASPRRERAGRRAGRARLALTTRCSKPRREKVSVTLGFFYLCPKRRQKEALSPTPTRTNRGKESRCTPEEGQRAGTADHAPQRDKQCRREPAGRACLGLQGTRRTWLHLPGVATTPHGP